VNFKRDKKILDIINQRSNRSTEIENQMETPINVQSTPPSTRNGEDGDRIVVDNDSGSFLYIKVGGRWLKSQLQEI